MDLLSAHYSRRICAFLLGSFALARLFPAMPDGALAFELTAAAGAASLAFDFFPRFGAAALAGVWAFSSALRLAWPLSLLDALATGRSSFALFQAWISRPGLAGSVLLLLWFAAFDVDRRPSADGAGRAAWPFGIRKPAAIAQWSFLALPALGAAVDGSWKTAAFAAGLVLLALHRPYRPWAAVGALGLAALATASREGGELFAYVLLGVASFGRAWCPPARARGGRAIFFFDGYCGVCDRAISWLLEEDRAGQIRVCPLQSPRAEAELGTQKPDDLGAIALKEKGEVEFRAQALLRAFSLLGGWWRALALALRFVPESALDDAYGWLESRRARLAPEREDLRVASPGDDRRFL